jgi:glycosyltransferase involved in cell wall biosynthesis
VRHKDLSVLMISPQFRPILGGYERAAERLSGSLARRGVRVVVLAERRERGWPAVEPYDGYEIRRFFCLYRRRLHRLSSVLSIGVWLLGRGRRFDVWHVHQYGVHAAMAIALGRLLRKPVVLKLTSSAAMGIGTALGTGPLGAVTGALHRRVDACLAVSEETRQEAIQFGIPPERIQLLPNGVDDTQFHPPSAEERAAVRAELGITRELLLLYVGRLSEEKNPLGLLEAWARVSPLVRAKATLALVGGGPDYDAVRARADATDMAGSVHVAGKRSDVESWYRAADAYVLPSVLEGLSNTMIEALASGLPVVSTAVSGSSILAMEPEAGLIVPVGDVAGLADAIERMLADDELRSRLGENARTKFLSRFSLSVLTGETVDLYRRLLGDFTRS